MHAAGVKFQGVIECPPFKSSMADAGPSQKKRSFDSAFKLKVVEFAEKNSNRGAGRQFGVDEKLKKVHLEIHESVIEHISVYQTVSPFFHINVSEYVHQSSGHVFVFISVGLTPSLAFYVYFKYDFWSDLTTCILYFKCIALYFNVVVSHCFTIKNVYAYKGVAKHLVW